MNTFVRLFWRRAIFDQTVDWLQNRGYHVVELDASSWTTEADLHQHVALALDFPDYYGQNLNALNDCFDDVVSYRYGTSREATGLVLAFTGYDQFSAHDPYAAHAVLNIIAHQARSGALFGHRMMCLVQSDDPSISFGPVGATAVEWNDAEWLNSERRPE